MTGPETWMQITMERGTQSAVVSSDLQSALASAHLAAAATGRGEPYPQMWAVDVSRDSEAFYFDPAAVRIIGDTLRRYGATPAPDGLPEGVARSRLYG